MGFEADDGSDAGQCAKGGKSERTEGGIRYLSPSLRPSANGKAPDVQLDNRMRGVWQRLAEIQLGCLTGSTRPHFCAASIAATLITGLFVEFTLAHFFLDPGVFDQFAKTTDCFIHTFMITQTQLNHKKPSSQGNQTECSATGFDDRILFGATCRTRRDDKRPVV
jgi:hypothetical protein